MSVEVSPASHASSSDLLVLRDRVLARGGLIFEAEIDVLRAFGPCGAVAFVLDVVVADHADLRDGLRLELVQLWNRQAAWTEARELAQTAAFEARALAGALHETQSDDKEGVVGVDQLDGVKDRDLTEPTPSERFDTRAAGVVEELALMTGSGPTFIQGRLEAARLLNPAGLLAETYGCLARGWITPGVARLMVTAAADLLEALPANASAEDRLAVATALQAQVLPKAISGIDPVSGVGCPKDYRLTRDAINRAANRIDPDRATRRRANARHYRGVTCRMLPDEGLAILTATLPITDAVEMFEHITDLASVLHDEDLAKVDTGEITPAEVRSVSQARADVLVEAVCRATALIRAGQPLPERAPWRIGVMIDLHTLLALRDGRCELPGIGELDPALARILAEDGEWKLFITDTVTGEILDAGANDYRPSEALRNYIRARDPHCTFPGCRKRSHRCQLDHIRPFPHGPTTRANLHPLCQHHHNLKTHGGWISTRDPVTAVTTWTSPRGVSVHVNPDRVEARDDALGESPVYDSDGRPPPF